MDHTMCADTPCKSDQRMKMTATGVNQIFFHGAKNSRGDGHFVGMVSVTAGAMYFRHTNAGGKNSE